MRDVSEREFINYVRGVGGYAAYSDAARDVETVLSALHATFTSRQLSTTAALFPPGLIKLWQRVKPADDASATACSQRRAILAVFAGLKEKLQENATQWVEILDTEHKMLWQHSQTIDSRQSAGQFL